MTPSRGSDTAKGSLYAGRICRGRGGITVDLLFLYEQEKTKYNLKSHGKRIMGF